MRSHTLNDDILVNILSFASLKTIPSMMQTCRVFYHEGPKVLLASGAAFGGLEQIPAFLRFILAEDGTRCRYLGQFHLLIEEEDDNEEGPVHQTVEMDTGIARSLVALFCHHGFPLLHTLALDPAEMLLTAIPGLSSALSTLPSVKVVNFRSAGPMTCKIIKGMRKLTDVRLAYSPSRWKALASQLHPLFVLEDSRNTLERLDVSFFDEPLPRSRYPQQFSQMRSLKLGWCSQLAIAPFAYAFPHLRRLTYEVMVDHDDLDTDEVIALHQQHRQEFSAYSTWRELEAASGRFFDLYVSGLACQINEVQVFMDPQQTFAMLHDFLNDVRPSKLYLRIPRHGIGVEASALPDLFRSQAGSRLRNLSLHIEFAQEEKDMDLGAAMVCALGTLHGLRSLELTFQCSAIPEIRLDVYTPSTLATCLAEEYLQQLDLVDFARSFLLAVPSLERVGVDLTGLRGRSREEVQVLEDGTVTTTINRW
ncbi:hypothetical protein BD309DRAFT_912360 [Dichomitus squalens]|nr:hypothetical protein BD309DRAFT_912360 [Dichomitus squalens]